MWIANNTVLSRKCGPLHRRCNELVLLTKNAAQLMSVHVEDGKQKVRRTLHYFRA